MSKSFGIKCVLALVVEVSEGDPSRELLRFGDLVPGGGGATGEHLPGPYV